MSSNPILTANPTLFVSEIQDVYLRKNFDTLRQYFNTENQLYGFKFTEQNFTKAENGLAFPHGLAVIPQDILVTRITGSGKVTFKFGQFTTTNIYLDVSGPCRIRFFYGTYWNFVSAVNNNNDDQMIVASGV